MNNNSTLPKKAPEYNLEDLFEAGCHFGHQKAKLYPRMKKFIYMEKDGVHIFDLEKTSKCLQEAYDFVYDLASKGKTMVVVGTKKQAREIIEKEAKEKAIPYITSRWLGGLLTNWSQVKLSLKKMIDIDTGLKAGRYENYTKFEKLQMEKEKTKLERFFIGIKDLKTTPDFLFVVDIKREKNVVFEANSMVPKVPVIAITDSNVNPDLVDYPIPANDDAVRSIEFIVKTITDAYAEGKKVANKATK